MLAPFSKVSSATSTTSDDIQVGQVREKNKKNVLRIRTEIFIVYKSSVTRYQINFSLYGFHKNKHLSKSIQNLPKRIQNCANFKINPQKCCQISLTFGQNGEISPNLVTLCTTFLPSRGVSPSLEGWKLGKINALAFSREWEKETEEVYGTTHLKICKG